MKEINILGETVEVKFSTYADGNATAIILLSKLGEPLCVMTTNIPGTVLGKDEVLIKTWSENKDTYNDMCDKGYLIPTGRFVEAGYTKAAICKIGDKLNDYR